MCYNKRRAIWESVLPYPQTNDNLCANPSTEVIRFIGSEYMKPYKTIDEQLDILESRNVSIPSKSFARRVLAYENYYHVING